MSPRMRVMVGSVSTLLFVFFGVSLFSAGEELLGTVLCALGAFRALVLLRQLFYLFRPEDDAP